MEVRVEDLNAVKKVIHIEIPEDVVVREIEDAYRDLNRKVKIKGFRVGKTPRPVLERLYKKSINADVTTKLIQQSFEDALKQTSLNVLGSPQIDPPVLEGKGVYKYEATVEVSPNIPNINIKELTLKKHVYRVEDEEIDLQLKVLQHGLGQHRPIAEKRPVVRGDIVIIDYQGFENNEPVPEIGMTENHVVKLDAGHFPKEIEDGLIGMNPGETKEITVTFPENTINKNLVNKAITFRITLKDIREAVLPDINDEFARKLGKYETLDELKGRIRENLNEEYKKRTDQELVEQIFRSILAKNDFDVPDVLVDIELQSIVQEAEQTFASHNTTMEEAGLTRDDLIKKYRPIAVNQVKRHLIMNKLIEQEGTSVSEQEVEESFKQISEALQKPIEEIRVYYKDADKRSYLKHSLLERKVIRNILDNCTIEEETQKPSGQ